MFPWFSDRHVREYAKAASRYYEILRQREEQQMNNKDHIERTKRMIEVMQAYVDGERIEYSLNGGEWFELKGPAWIHQWQYRIAKAPDELDWSLVNEMWKYRARDSDGRLYFYENEPYIRGEYWDVDEGEAARVDSIFASYRKGTVDWKESLVIRPGCE